MTQTPYERLKAARLRKKRGLVSVAIPSQKITFDIPSNRIKDLVRYAKNLKSDD